MTRRVWTFISLAVIVPVGFESKFYRGPACVWVNDSLGGAFYDIFWCLAAFFVFPEGRPLAIAVCVLVCTCILEFTQLWHPPFLEYLRGYFIGRTILGTTFAWSDFPYYFMGSAAGWCWMKALQRWRV
jgi:hypothetical protein